MVEIGKRQQRDNDYEGKQQKKRLGYKDNTSDSELVVYRILCPVGVIGGVIGKSGKVINNIRKETHAKIQIVDPFPGADKRVITIYCYVREKNHIDIDEDVLEPLCPAQDALLKVHEAIVNVLDNSNDTERSHKHECHMLVPASQSANIIGKSGTTIKKLRSKTGANIQIMSKDPANAAHSCAMSYDNFLQITGDAEAVETALTAISAIMYKFSPKEEISLDTSIPDLPPIIIPSDVPIIPAGSLYSHTDSLLSPGSVPPVIPASRFSSEISGFTDTTNVWPFLPSTVPIVPGYGAPTHSEDLVLQVLCPSDKIGRVIGKGGSTIKSIRQSSGATISVDDKKDDTDECIITVTSTESTNDVKSSAIEAVLLLQEKINDQDDNNANIRLLVPSKAIGCLIGKSGSIINDMRKSTKAIIYISKGKKPKNASSDSELVEVSGEVGRLRDALRQVVFRLREDSLKDKESNQNVHKDTNQNVPLHSSSLSVSQVLPENPPRAPLNYDHRVEAERGLGGFSGSSLYGYNTMPARDSYGSLSSYSSKSYGGGLPAYFDIVIPPGALSKVMGKGGTNLDNIRKISGAHVEVVDSKTSPFERVARISGTAEQKRTAENLIQAFIMST
ncbi:KH domain-containing protein At4g18375-like [Zingiber officinale]|uniref:KH domain-containing protein At4g18375-like n=1 Tax=Zingiber officinale TaxID=94328 RepID=UPI001C4C1C49|nr:KH domain-containing protein At4g18375-like [Zingiber officinale]XP_042378735.1 KH domain-containing protein At4g18375-like [Zingiber officinale]